MTDTTKTEALRLAQAPQVPGYVMTCIHAYGDARADDDGTSAQHLRHAIEEMRKWAAAERDRLAAECEALRADAAMLGWLASHCASHDEPSRGGWSIHVAGPVPTRHDCEDAFRDAITAAMGGKE